MFFTAKNVGATDALRLIVVAGALQFVFGWTKSLPGLDRPAEPAHLAHGVETLVLVPLVVVLGAEWGATGAAGAVLVSTVVFAVALDACSSCGSGVSPTRSSAGTAAVEVGCAVKVLVVSGIWPPDVGGPASHAPEVAAFLRARGHEVEVVTTADAAGARRTVSGALGLAQRCRPASGTCAAPRSSTLARARADVVYTTGMFGRSALGRARRAHAVRREADRRSRRSSGRAAAGSSTATSRSSSAAAAAVRLPLCGSRATSSCGVRRTSSRPSAYLRELALGWGVAPERVGVLPNPAPAVPELPPREELRRELGLNGPTLAFAGRLTAQKSLERRARGGCAAPRVAARDRGRRARIAQRSRSRRASSALPTGCASSVRSRASASSSSSGGRRDAPVLELGELPAHGRGGARRRDAGDRDGGGRRAPRS